MSSILSIKKQENYMKNTLIRITLIPIMILMINLALVGKDATNKEKNINTCLECHSELEYLPSDFSEDDVHLSAELSCIGCHGGDDQIFDSEESMNTAKGFIAIPSKAEIPGLCGKCHSSIEYMRTFRPRIATDQVSQYYTSLHGKQLLQGDFNVATCTDCHRVHSIFKADDPRSSIYPINIPETCNQCHGEQELMNQYGIPADQFSKYSNSVHGTALLENKDIYAPTCNDCHGNHGAMPPEVKSISHVCGNCHVNNMEYFLNSPMAKNLEETEFHACEECHGHHDIMRANDNFLGNKETSVCLDCHYEDGDAFKISRTMYKSITNLSDDCDSIETKLEEIQVIGMNDIEISYLLQEARQQLIESRTSIHSFDTSIVLTKTRKGEDLIEQCYTLAENEFNKYDNRKNGFIYTTFAFLILAAGIFLKIRNSNQQIKKKDSLSNS